MEGKHSFALVKPRRLSDDAAEQIVNLVKSGQLPPGTKLPSEREMVEQLGVSRTSYREAVRILETMGILEVVSGRGTWIVERGSKNPEDGDTGWLVTHERDIIDLFMTRYALETQAVALAAERGSEAQFEEIARQLDRIRQAVLDNDTEGAMVADKAFHAAVVAASDNRVLVELLAGILASLDETAQAMMRVPGRLRRMEAEHLPISEAIFARDPEAAARAMAGQAAKLREEVLVAIHGMDALERG